MIRIGDMNTFIVVRESNIGYMLMNKEDQVLLHYRQCGDKKLELNSMVECFVQYDSEGRVAATLEEPVATLTKPGLATVVAANARLGFFVSIGTFKDILVSKDDLPKDANIWPNEGEKVFVKLAEKNGKLIAKILNKEEVNNFTPTMSDYKVGEKICGFISRVTPKAINGVTETLNYFYVPEKQFRGLHHIGEFVELTVMSARDGEVVCSLNKILTELMLDDETTILDYLNSHNGKMIYTAKSDAEAIEKAFHMSRKAFKRALGALYKKGTVECTDYQTTLKK